MFTNRKECYISTADGSSFLVEVEEHHGNVMLTMAGRTLHLNPDSAFDLADILTMVANEIDSHIGGFNVN